MISFGNEMGLFFNNLKYLQVIRSLMIFYNCVNIILYINILIQKYNNIYIISDGLFFYKEIL